MYLFLLRCVLRLNPREQTLAQTGKQITDSGMAFA